MAQPRLINLGVGGLLRTPVLHRIGSSYLMLLRFTGRKTGRAYTVPVGYFRDGGIVLTTTDDRWWRNLTTAAPVTMLLQRRQYTGVGQAITELGAAVEGMAALVAGCPRYGQWINVGCSADGRPSRDDLEREVGNGRVLIRISGVEPAGNTPSLNPTTAAILRHQVERPPPASRPREPPGSCRPA